MPMRVLITLLAAALVLSACRGAAAERETVVVGVGATTEQQVLAALTMVALQRAEIPAELRLIEGTTVQLRSAALRGGIDLFWDYTGAAWSLGLGEQAPPADADESWERVRRADEEHGLLWLPPADANATLALFVRASDLPPPDQPRGMTWLAGVLSASGEQEGALCADPDFLERPLGLRAFAEEYAIDLVGLRRIPASEGEAIAGVVAGRCFAGLATATSGAARNAGLVPVADELGVFPAFIVAPVVRADSAADRPEVTAALAPVTAALDTRALADINAALEAGANPEDLAARFVDAPGGSGGVPPAEPGGSGGVPPPEGEVRAE